VANVALAPTPANDIRRFGRVALVHDWLAAYAGSEKVVEQILQLFPQADLYSIVDFFPESQREVLGGKRAHTSFIQHLPRARKWFRHYLPLMPLAIEQFDLSGYDLVISSNHAVAKGVLTGPHQVHVSYVHSPIRYAWDLQHQYLAEAGMQHGMKSWIVRLLLHYMRIWDHRTAHGVDAFVANSAFVGRRIQKAYGSEATVVYPPVDVERFELCTEREDVYLVASRMVPYKRIPLIVEAFAAMPSRRLVVIGDGSDFARAKACATPNVTLLGYQPDAVLVDWMQRARAFVFAAEEDFGISVVEAQACGTPVIAFGRGGVREIVLESPDPERATGLFFNEQSVASIVDAVERFEQSPPFRAEVCRRNALRFTRERFKREFLSVVERAVDANKVPADPAPEIRRWRSA
jgi:glycosyltransferase involved in cell wall biosynthesis